MPSRRRSVPDPLGFGWNGSGLVAGVDEVGRGPLAGPVVAAAVILDDLKPVKGLRDSKALTALRRERLFDEIMARALCVSIAEASVQEIDHLNILQATLLAMQRAVDRLRLPPTLVLVDGNRLPVLKAPAQAIVKGAGPLPAVPKEVMDGRQILLISSRFKFTRDAGVSATTEAVAPTAQP